MYWHMLQGKWLYFRCSLSCQLKLFIAYDHHDGENYDKVRFFRAANIHKYFFQRVLEKEYPNILN